MINNNRIINSRDILKNISAGLSLLDPQLNIVWVNKVQADWFGVPEVICGQKCFATFEKRPHICRGCPTVKVFKTGNVHQARRIGITTDGKRHYYHLTVSPIKDNEGKVIFALELVQDVTAGVIREKSNIKITRKLETMYRHLSSINRRLRGNVDKLKNLSNDLSGCKRVLEKKFRKKECELSVVKKEMQDILKVNKTLISTVDVKRISSLVTHLTCELMSTDACILWLVDEHKKILVVNSVYAGNGYNIKNLPKLKMGESVAGRVAVDKKPISVYDIEREKRLQYKEFLRHAGVNSFLCVPVLFQGKALGAISAYSRKSRIFTKEEIEVMTIFAAQVAIAIQESRYYDDIRKNYFNTIHALVLAIEARDPYTRGHTDRVTKYAMGIARNLNVDESDIEMLRYAAEVHDIGKISIPDVILNKPGRLTPAERAMIELHPLKGVEMLEPLEFLKPAIPIVRYHHERFDGTGYPDGLEKESIPLLARILSCADSFDAMTSERPYRNRKLTVEEALNEIRNNAGSQFDPFVARLFIKSMRQKSV